MRRTTKNGSSLSVTIFIIFLILKLTGSITWSWLWVTCPLWIGVALFLVGIFVMLLITTSIVILATIFGNNNKF
jgi:hypothetical protein